MRIFSVLSVMAVISLGFTLPAEAKKKRSEISSLEESSSPSSFSSGSSSSSRRKILVGGGLGFYGPSSGTMWVD
ncbi:MAG: hypothetical protein K2X47_02540, partial [Bdellovibrionales bacterium]|nr:hypothetical protein [Bdellovibrionales bacterium]